MSQRALKTYPAGRFLKAPAPRLLSCHNCADNETCGLDYRVDLAGCTKWRCRVCRGPWWVTSMAHERCIETGVPNGIFYHDGGHMAPLSDASGHYMTHGGIYCEIHKSWRCMVGG